MVHGRLPRNWQGWAERGALCVGLCSFLAPSGLISSAQMQSGLTKRLVWLKVTSLSNIRVRIIGGCYPGSPLLFPRACRPRCDQHQVGRGV